MENRFLLPHLAIEGAHFEEFVASKLPVDPCLPTTGLEQADRQPLLRQSV